MTDVTTQTTPPAPALGTSSRIDAAFDRLKAHGRTALMPYHTAGWPTMAISEEIILGLIEGGADLVEIGVPFSDPIADGTSVQRTSQLSLEQGTRLRDCIALVRRLRDRGATVPFLLMGYYNPIVKYGVERYVVDCAAAGVDGFIVPDLPASESGPLLAACEAHRRDLIFMIAPTSTDERITVVAERGSGFIYCVSVTGVTNARDQMSPTLGPYLKSVREKTDLPLAVGFGISRPDHVRLVAEHAEGAIVGAALINYLDSLPDDKKPAGGARFVHYLRGEAEL